VTEFLEDHPGGSKILLKNCGKDSSDAFWNYHSEKVLKNVASEYKIGELKPGAKL
jgi:cytochrome b involved in lipid metabolism